MSERICRCVNAFDGLDGLGLGSFDEKGRLFVVQGGLKYRIRWKAEEMKV